MIWIILAALGVPLWLIAIALLTLLVRNRTIRNRPGNVPVRVRVPGHKEVGPRSRRLCARRVRVPRGPPAAWDEVLEHIEGVTVRPATAEEAHQLRGARRPDHRHPHHHRRALDRGGGLGRGPGQPRGAVRGRSRGPRVDRRRGSSFGKDAAGTANIDGGCELAGPAGPTREDKMSRKRPEDQARGQRHAHVDRSMRTHIFEGEEVVLVAHPGRLATLPSSS